MELTKEIWTQSDYDEFAEYLKTLADEKYKKFSDSLVPGGTQSIGIRVPILRQTAKAISKGDQAIRSSNHKLGNLRHCFI